MRARADYELARAREQVRRTVMEGSWNWNAPPRPARPFAHGADGQAGARPRQPPIRRRRFQPAGGVRRAHLLAGGAELRGPRAPRLLAALALLERVTGRPLFAAAAIRRSTHEDAKTAMARDPRGARRLRGGGCSGKDAAGDAAAALAERAALLVSPDDVVQARTIRLESGVSFTGELTPIQITDVVARFEADLEKVLVREGQAVRRSVAGGVRATGRGRCAAVRAGRAAGAQAALAAAESAHRRRAGCWTPAPRLPATWSRPKRPARPRRLACAPPRRSATTARENSQELAVPAPIGGSISRLMVHDGSRTAVGDPLMTIVDTRTLELSATLASEALAGVQPGAASTLPRGRLSRQSFEGVVDRVNPTTNPALASCASTRAFPT